MNNRRAPLIAFAVASSLLLNSCATGPGPGNGTNSADLKQVCSPLVIGIGAAALCSAFAKGNKRVKTGAACGAAAVLACYLANSYKTEQTRSAQEVQADYVRSHNRLPEQATVTNYRSELSPPGAVMRGQEVKLLSTIVAVPGRNDRGLLIEEEISIVDRLGEIWGEPKRKTANAGNQGGEYRTSFVIPVTDGMSQGVYTIRRALYVNNVAVQRDDSGTRFQVVQNEAGSRLLSLR